MQIDEEELQILQDFERGEFQSIRNYEAEKRELEAANIERCIGSFRAHAGERLRPSGIEIIVVDNDSTDGTAALALAAGAAVYTKGPERSAQRNHGALEVARGDLIVRKQFGFYYRFCGVFLENGKWRRSLLRPDRLFAVWTYRVLVGIMCLRGLRSRAKPIREAVA